MPDIDLKPHEFAERDQRTGRLRREMSPRWFRNWLIIVLVMIGYVFWNRAVVDGTTLLCAGLGLGAMAGVFLFGWLRNVY